MSRETTVAASGSMRWWRQATWVATANGMPCPPISTTRTRRRASWLRGHWSGWRGGMLSRPGRWLVLLRGVLVIVGAVAVALTNFPPSYEPWAWAVVGFFAAETVFSGALSVIELGPVTRVRARRLLLALDAVVAIGFISVFSFEKGEPFRALYLIPIAAAALRFGLVGGLIGGAVMTGATLVIDALGPGLQWRTVFARVLVGMIAGL